MESGEDQPCETFSSQPNQGESGNEMGEDWCTITQKKTKRKKKQRPVPLKDIFTDTKDGSGTVRTEFIRSAVGGEHRYLITPLPELNDEEEIIAESVRSYLIDILEKLGPITVDSPRLREELEALEDSGRAVLYKYGSIAAFLTISPAVCVVDKLICTKSYLNDAKNLALKSIFNNSEFDELSSKRNAARTWGQAKGSSNPWSGGKHQENYHHSYKTQSIEATSTGPNMQNSSGAFVNTYPSNLNVPPPTLSKPPPGIPVPPMTSMFSTSLPASGSLEGFGGIGNVSSSMDVPMNRLLSHDPHHQAMLESLNKRMVGLTKCNGELMKALQEKEQTISNLKGILATLESRCKALEGDSTNNDGPDTVEDENSKEDASGKVRRPSKNVLSETQLIIQLQKQLESEKLNSQTLKQQLEIERERSASLSEKCMFYARGLSGLTNGSAHFANGTSFRSLSEDSLGLRSLIDGLSKLQTDSESLGITQEVINDEIKKEILSINANIGEEDVKVIVGQMRSKFPKLEEVPMSQWMPVLKEIICQKTWEERLSPDT